MIENTGNNTSIGYNEPGKTGEKRWTDMPKKEVMPVRNCDCMLNT